VAADLRTTGYKFGSEPDREIPPFALRFVAAGCNGTADIEPRLGMLGRDGARADDSDFHWRHYNGLSHAKIAVTVCGLGRFVLRVFKKARTRRCRNGE
jgi:hypothetical protein